MDIQKEFGIFTGPKANNGGQQNVNLLEIDDMEKNTSTRDSNGEFDSTRGMSAS